MQTPSEDYKPLPLYLKAGYIIDEILDLEQNKEMTTGINIGQYQFKICSIGVVFNFDNPEPITSVIHNLISRGTPTRASKFLTEKVLGSEAVIHDTEVIYEIVENDKICQQSELLIRVAQVQKVITMLFASNQLNIDENQVSVFCSSDFQDTVRLAFDDIKVWYNTLVLLKDNGQRFPEIAISNVYEQSYDLAISYRFDILNDVNALMKIDISPAETSSAVTKFITSSKIEYQSIGKSNENSDGRFEYDSQEKEDALIYILQSIFRKKDFRAGQLPILNRVLQGQDVIGLLPTGGGKSLTYQLAGLLQPALTIIIDPINSLMRDQYDKLREMYIDATVYINSYNSQDERTENEERLVNGEILFSFVSPERLQIQKFRDHLLMCKSNGVYFGYAVIDEAHCVSEWGHDFRMTYLGLESNLRSFCLAKSSQLTLFALTATASYDVLADIQRELKMQDDAIQSLPADQIDRKELIFDLVPIDETGIKEPGWLREKKLAVKKYPKIEEHLEQFKQKFYKAISSNINILDLQLQNPSSFKEKQKTEKNILAFRTYLAELDTEQNFLQTKTKFGYKNAGIIFCQTASDALGNGVVAFSGDYGGMLSQKTGEVQCRGLRQRIDSLDIVTFCGSDDHNQRANENVATIAKESFNNQTKFLSNQANLMIATKGFGMGIDKPNVRYTIHYGLPNSVESFYQEAGRAGRDGKPSLCSIFYCPEDVITNSDFLNNSFKNVLREQAIIKELLEEVRYENKFLINYLGAVISENFNQKIEVSVRKTGAVTRLYIQTKVNKWKLVDGKSRPDDPKMKDFGNINLTNNLYINADRHNNQTTFDEATSVLEFTKSFILKNSHNVNVLDWLNQIHSFGIESLAVEGVGKQLIVGFTNNEVSKITQMLLNENVITEIKRDVISKDGNKYSVDDTERFVRAAYNFCEDEIKFVNDKLPYEFARQTGKPLKIPNDIMDRIKVSFNQIRNDPDTQRAIYRMSIIGIVDDYTIDFPKKAIIIKFSKKSDEEYERRFVNYLARYVGSDRCQHWVNKIKEKEEGSILQKYLFTLIEFIYDIIVEKRKRSIEYVEMLCASSLRQKQVDEDVNQFFREDIILYFTSKFAKNSGDGSLNEDTDKGIKGTFDIVIKYLGYIQEAPDKLGDEISNIKHLKGACARMLTSYPENKAIRLLDCYTTLILEAKSSKILSISENTLLKSACIAYNDIFKEYFNDNYIEWVNSISMFNKELFGIQPALEAIIDPIHTELVLERQNIWLSNFNQKFIDIDL